MHAISNVITFTYTGILSEAVLDVTYVMPLLFQKIFSEITICLSLRLEFFFIFRFMNQPRVNAVKGKKLKIKYSRFAYTKSIIIESFPPVMVSLNDFFPHFIKAGRG